MDANTRRAAAVKLYASRYRFVPRDQIRELHAQGLADSEIGERLLVSKCTVRKYRKLDGLPTNTERALLLQGKAGRRGVETREAGRLAERTKLAQVCRLPLVPSALGLKVVTALISGGLTRLTLSQTLETSADKHGGLARALRKLRRDGVVKRVSEIGPKRGGKLPAVWSLTDETIRRMYTPGERLSPLQQRLIEDPLATRCVPYFVKQFGRKAPHMRDEIQSAAHEGLMAAARTYNPDRGRAFSSHAYQRIWGQIINELRVRTGHRRTGPKVISGWGETACPADFKKVPDRQHRETDSSDQFEFLIRCVSKDRDKEIMRLRFVQDMTIYEIADQVGLCYTRVYNIITDTLEHMKEVVPCPTSATPPDAPSR